MNSGEDGRDHDKYPNSTTKRWSRGMSSFLILARAAAVLEKNFVVLFKVPISRHRLRIRSFWNYTIVLCILGFSTKLVLKFGSQNRGGKKKSCAKMRFRSALLNSFATSAALTLRR